MTIFGGLKLDFWIESWDSRVASKDEDFGIASVSVDSRAIGGVGIVVGVGKGAAEVIDT